MKNLEEVVNNSVSLSDAISMIQDELIESQRKRREAGKPVLFETDKLTIEANCVFVKKDSENAGLGFRLLSLLDLSGGVNKSVESSLVQKITLELKVADLRDGTMYALADKTGRYLRKREV